MFFMISSACPWTPAGEPALAPSGSASKYAYPPRVFNGVPWYFLKNIIIVFIITGAMVLSILSVPKVFPAYSEKSLDEDSSDDEMIIKDDEGDYHMKVASASDDDDA